MQKILCALAIKSLIYAQACMYQNIMYTIRQIFEQFGIGSLESNQKGHLVSSRNKRLEVTHRRLDQLKIIGYFDFNFVGCQDDCRYTLGYIYLLVGEVLSKHSKFFLPLWLNLQHVIRHLFSFKFIMVERSYNIFIFFKLKKINK